MPDQMNLYIKKNKSPIIGFVILSLLFVIGSFLYSYYYNKNNSISIKFTVLQINDVYELFPVSDQGGLARVATLKKMLAKENPNTIAVLAGDFVSPSVIGLSKIDDKKIAGKQMVDALNPFLDLVTIGNHEFDIKEHELLENINNSKFKWISSNIWYKDNKPLPKVAENYIYEFKGSGGQSNNSIKVGFFAVTLDNNNPDWVVFNMNLVKIAKQQIEKLTEQGANVIVALTHLNIEDDVLLAELVPEIDVVMGGHDHENINMLRGVDFTPIYKANANARTAYIHKFDYNLASNQLRIKSNIQIIDSTIPDDPHVTKIAQKWQNLAYDGFRRQGIYPDKHIAYLTEDLDGRESLVRFSQGKLPQLILTGMIDATGADCAIINGGAIRIDDTLHQGVIKQYDVLRILPFGNTIVMVEMSGKLLSDILTIGIKNKSTGGYLHYGNITSKNNMWRVDGQVIDPNKTYKVATIDFLLLGKEHNLEFLNTENPDIKLVNDNAGDIRKALIKVLDNTYPDHTSG